jgi:hypothetical protein
MRLNFNKKNFGQKWADRNFVQWRGPELDPKSPPSLLFHSRFVYHSQHNTDERMLLVRKRLPRIQRPSLLARTSEGKQDRQDWRYTLRDRRPCTTACLGCWAGGHINWNSVRWGKNILYMLNRAGKAGKKSLIPRLAQRTNQGPLSYVTFESQFQQSAGATPLWSLWARIWKYLGAQIQPDARKDVMLPDTRKCTAIFFLQPTYCVDSRRCFFVNFRLFC